MKIKRHLIYLLVICLYSCAAGDYSTDLGDRYLFVSESNANQFIYNMDDTTGRRSIPCTVEEFKFDERYIVAKQNPNKDCSKKGFTGRISKFYIIDKKKNIEYGPLDSMAYQKKKQSLSIDLNLKQPCPKQDGIAHLDGGGTSTTPKRFLRHKRPVASPVQY